jgi:hypothetical protein
VEATKDGAPGLDRDRIEVPEPDSCTLPPAKNATVNASYRFQYTIPLVRTATLTLKAKGVMRCGG